MTLMSEALDILVFDGNTKLFKKNEEFTRHRHLSIGVDIVCFFLTNDDIR